MVTYVFSLYVRKMTVCVNRSLRDHTLSFLTNIHFISTAIRTRFGIMGCYPEPYNGVYEYILKIGMATKM